MRSLGLLRLVIGFLAVLFALSINAFGQSGPCTLTVTPASGFAPLNVSATASCDPQSGFFLQAIDWRDGNQDPFPPGQTSGSLTHTYATPSSYFVGLSAANATGTQTFANQNVTVDTPVACKLAMNPSRRAAHLSRLQPESAAPSMRPLPASPLTLATEVPNRRSMAAALLPAIPTRNLVNLLQPSRGKTRMVRLEADFSWST